MIIRSLLHSTNSPFYAMSSFRFVFVDEQGKPYQGKSEYEHMITRSGMAAAALSYLNGKITEDQLTNFLSNTHTANLPEKINEILNKFHKSTMSDNFNMDDLIEGKLSAILDRYISFEMFNSPMGKEMQKLGLRLIDLKTNQEVKEFSSVVKASSIVQKNRTAHEIVNNAVDSVDN